MQATALAAEPHDAVVASTTGDARNWVSSACLSNVERRRADVELELRLSLHALAEMADERVVAHALAPHLDRSPAAHHPRNTYRSANLSSNLRSVTLSEYEAGALVRRSSSGQADDPGQFSVAVCTPDSSFRSTALAKTCSPGLSRRQKGYGELTSAAGLRRTKVNVRNIASATACRRSDLMRVFGYLWLPISHTRDASSCATAHHYASSYGPNLLTDYMLALLEPMIHDGDLVVLDCEHCSLHTSVIRYIAAAFKPFL